MIKKNYCKGVFIFIFSFFFNFSSAQIQAFNDDAYPLGAMCNILANDLLNSQAIMPSDVVITTSPPIGISTDGFINYATLPPGTSVVTYQICEAANLSSCATATINIHNPGFIIATDDTFTGIDGALGGATASVLINDSINGINIAPSQVLVTLFSSSSPNLAITPTGVVIIAPGTQGGTYTLVYQICEALNFINCDTAMATIQVVSPIPPCWQSVSIGDFHSAAIKADGTLWSWGNNGLGSLGIGNTIDSSDPVQVGTDTDWKLIAVGDFHTLAIKNNGTLWAWGWNQNGQIGDGTTTDRNSPVQIGTDTDWKSVSALYASSSALKNNNTLWGWGDNSSGIIGNGSTVNPQLTPIQVTTDTNWKSISVGDAHTMAIKTTGTLWTWGINDRGQLGNGTTTNVATPIPTGSAASFNQWKSVSASRRYTLGLLNDGTMWAWGENAIGQLGNGTTIDQNIPIQVGTDTNWAEISAGYYHRLAIKNDGTLWAWGINQVGALGNGTTTDSNAPIQIGTDTDWVKISAKYNHSAAVKSDGSLWVWGRNNFGQLGDGTNTNQLSPMMVDCNQILANNDAYSPIDGSIGGTTATVLLNDALNGNPVTTSQVSVTMVSATNPNLSINGAGVITIASGTAAGTYTLTYQICELAVSSNCDTATATIVVSAPMVCWDKFSLGGGHTLSIKTDGTLWAWGASNFGQLGDGTLVNKNYPVQIGSDNDWRFIATGGTCSHAIKNNGTLWAWGNNEYAQLGDGTYTNTNIPIQIGSDTNWKSISDGDNHVLAVKSNGTLWAWGLNSFGALGDGTHIARTAPVQIGSATDWESCRAGGAAFSIARKTNGSLYLWGYNYGGQLGNGTNTSLDIPTLLDNNSWSTMYGAGSTYSIAMQSGTIYSWGDNTYGTLGDGTNTSTNTPSAIGTDTDWSFVDSGYYYAIAKKNNGTIWTWGYNFAGQLGTGNNADSNSPIQMNTDTDWNKIYAGYHHVIATKNDGTYWTWGWNQGGQLGDGTFNSRNAPIQLTCATLANDAVAAIKTFSIYPNPASHSITIEATDKITKVEVIDVNGRTVSVASSNTEIMNLNIEKFATGIYMIKLTTEKGTSTQKFIKI